MTCRSDVPQEAGSLKVSRDPDGTIDEVFAHGVPVHFEMLNHDEACLILGHGEGTKLFNIVAERRGILGRAVLTITEVE